VFVGFFEIAVVGATTEALVTIPKVDAYHLRTANFCNIVIAVFAGAIILALSDFLAQSFGSTELGPVFRMLAPLPLISALTATPIAILSRQSQFDSLALRSIVGLAAGGIVGIVLALGGAGVESLIAQALVQRLVELGMLWASARTRFGFGWSRPHFMELRGYAISVLISRAMSWAAGQLPRSILGWYLGPSDLGLFVLASRLVDVMIQVVIVPRTSVARINLRHFNEDPDAMASAFNDVVRQVAILSFPVSCGFAAVIPTLFAAFLDSRWLPGIPAAQILATIVIPLTFYYCCTAALLAAKQPHLDSWSSVLLTAGNVLAVLVAAPFGIIVVCSALVLQVVGFLPIPLSMLRRVCGLSPVVLVCKQLPLLGAAVVMGIGVMMIAPVVELEFGPKATILVLIAVGLAIYFPLAALAAPNDIRRLAQQVIATMQRTVNRRY